MVLVNVFEVKNVLKKSGQGDFWRHDKSYKICFSAKLFPVFYSSLIYNCLFLLIVFFLQYY